MLSHNPLVNILTEPKRNYTLTQYDGAHIKKTVFFQFLDWEHRTANNSQRQYYWGAGEWLVLHVST